MAEIRNAPKKSAVLPLLRAGLRALAVAAPPLAVRAAAALFRTPPRHKTSETERQLLASGRSGRLRAGSSHIATWAWGEGPTVLLVHGWGSRGARLGSFVEPLVSAGYSVVTFDSPAHGDSSGRLSSLPQFIEALLTVARSCEAIHGVVAHSMGGAAAALAMARGLEVERAVLLAPAANPGTYTRVFAQMLGISPSIRERMERRFETQFGFRFEEFDVPSAASSFSTPLLVFHDREDREVAWKDGDAIAKSWPGAQLVTTQGLGHIRIVHDPGIVRRAVDFLVGARLRREAGVQA
ncbi:MAG TPA: alpha/beta hydrolase [Thermoanaerobaculia bacterium]